MYDEVYFPHKYVQKNTKYTIRRNIKMKLIYIYILSFKFMSVENRDFFFVFVLNHGIHIRKLI
jgi:hypothetical protein